MAEKINSKELKENLNNYYVIDVREADEFAAGHIENAINIPL